MFVEVKGEKRELPQGASCADALRTAFSGKQMSRIVAARCLAPGEKGEEGRLLDLSAPVPENCAVLEPVDVNSPEGLKILRHSAAHVMACAVKKLFPKARVTIGPAIENGFYYDFDVEKPFSQEDFAAIEKEMKSLADAALPFTHELMDRDKAAKFFADEGENYKLELLEDIPDEKVGIYSCGSFTDLCRGPHVPNTGFVKNFKLLSTAGAYWRGDEKNAMLARIYGTAFADKKDLDAWLYQQEEAKKRDHRKLGRELAYFHFEEEVAPGMVFWLPKGMLTRVILEDFWRREHLKRGYELVQGPQILRVETWKKSGHYQHYRKNMYFTRITDDMDGPEAQCAESDASDWHGIKPMNCIGHMLIYQRDLHSYRDLPLRFFELGVVHRHEKSGVLHGLMRVRQFTQDDAHILCAPEHLEAEILSVIHLIQDLMNLFDFRFEVNISTRPEESIGTDEAWEMATQALMEAVARAGLKYRINPGDGAFYGPKIDVILLDSLGRQWQCSTIQVDFNMPERFDLHYIGRDGEKHRPVMVHRAIMGSIERFIGILLEHFAGALPVWLAPEQAKILTVTEAAEEAAKKIRAQLQERGIRVGIDLRNEKLGFKVREAQLAKIPFILVMGEKEAQTGTVSPRLRDGKNLGPQTVDEVVAMIQAEEAEPFKQGGMSYSFAQC